MAVGVYLLTADTPRARVFQFHLMGRWRDIFSFHLRRTEEGRESCNREISALEWGVFDLLLNVTERDGAISRNRDV